MRIKEKNSTGHYTGKATNCSIRFTLHFAKIRLVMSRAAEYRSVFSAQASASEYTNRNEWNGDIASNIWTLSALQACHYAECSIDLNNEQFFP